MGIFDKTIAKQETVNMEIDAEVKSFSCKSFSQRITLMIHQRIHTEKPFTCDHCNKCYCKKSNLIMHQRIHTVEKAFPCDHCNKRFNQNTNLIRNQRIHTG